MMLRQATLAATLAAMAAVVTATKQPPASTPKPGAYTPMGCFNDLGSLKKKADLPYNTEGACSDECIKKGGFYVAAMYYTECYCGNEYPPESAIVDDTKCNEICPGFEELACGGIGVWSVYNTGERTAVPYAEEEETSSSSSSTSTTSSATSTGSGPTATADPIATPTESDAGSGESDGGSSNGTTIGIAVGVTAGVLVLLGVAGGAWMYRRKQQNSEIEEEHRRNAAVNAFISGGKPPSSSSGMSMSDARLDPVFANRRMSDGSIADNQDYSRRILRVTNA